MNYLHVLAGIDSSIATLNLRAFSLHLLALHRTLGFSYSLVCILFSHTVNFNAAFNLSEWTLYFLDTA